MWLPRSATTEEKLTTLPLPCSTITGMTCRQHRNGPFRSRLMVRSQTERSTSVASLSSRREPPAQFSSTSMWPNTSLACRTICLTLASSVTSVRTKRAPAPASRALASPSASSISATTTLAPSATNIFADARPMPEPAPVITATLPARRFICPSPVRGGSTDRCSHYGASPCRCRRSTLPTMCMFQRGSFTTISAQRESLVAMGGHLVAFLAVFRGTAGIGHEGALLPPGHVLVDPGHPRIDLHQQEPRGGLMHMRGPCRLGGRRRLDPT